METKSFFKLIVRFKNGYRYEVATETDFTAQTLELTYKRVKSVVSTKIVPIDQEEYANLKEIKGLYVKENWEVVITTLFLPFKISFLMQRLFHIMQK